LASALTAKIQSSITATEIYEALNLPPLRGKFKPEAATLRLNLGAIILKNTKIFLIYLFVRGFIRSGEI
jgi:hypothetical protein